MQNAILRVEGMSCSHCENAIIKAVNALDGISNVTVDLHGKTVTVDYDMTKVSSDSIKEAIVDQGYDVV